MTKTAQQHPPPSILLAMAEPQRAMIEATSLMLSSPWLLSLPRGDGHPVYVMPGFMAGDQSTSVLRRFLKELGYQTFGWGFGRNLGPRGKLFAAVQLRLRDIYETCGNRKVTLIGWSLGGIYAREIARQRPELVRQVVTLASPFGAGIGGGTNPQVARLFEALNGESPEVLARELLSEAAEPPPVPSTSVYSRTDGVAHWRVCLERRTPQTDNVEVVGSHSGMGFNPAVFYVVGDRLAQKDGQWKMFDRTGMRCLMFPPAQFAP